MYSAHTQSPGRAHTARVVPRFWALLRAQLTGRAHSQRMLRACWRALVATRPGNLPQVATSLRCCDIKATRIMSRHQIGVATPFLLSKPKPGRDTRTRSRPSWRLPYVATSISCRDFVSQQARSRHQFHVTTSWRLNLCRDIKSMWRPPTLSPMSRHQIHVVTPFLPTVGFPGLDTKIQVATSHTATHVVTSTQLSPFLLRRDAIFPCRDLKMMSRHQCQLAKIPGRHPETCCNPARSRRHFLVATSHPTKPGRDLKSMSRPQIGPLHLFFFFFQNHPVAFLPATPLM